ncbi:MAG: SDR family oxidoreductase, partial [Nocardioidaceae bacterium]
MTAKTAVVTGASSGIGEATARRLAAEGFHVFCAARRGDRVEQLAKEIGGTAVTCDVTSPESVRALADRVGDRLDVLVNNAGGAFGAAPVAQADLDDWRAMYEVNVIGLVRVTQALLPALKATGAGIIVNLGSTAGRIAYEGGGGYTAAKHGTQVVSETLRLELYDQPVRVCEIAPGMVRTDEFALVRFGGDREKADAVYAGV